jgi:hypothetical protein
MQSLIEAIEVAGQRWSCGAALPSFENIHLKGRISP